MHWQHALAVLAVPDLPKPPSDPNPKSVTFVTDRQTDTQTDRQTQALFNRDIPVYLESCGGQVHL